MYTFVHVLKVFKAYNFQLQSLLILFVLVTSLTFFGLTQNLTAILP